MVSMPPNEFMLPGDDEKIVVEVSWREIFDEIFGQRPRPVACPDIGNDGHNHPANPCPKCGGNGQRAKCPAAWHRAPYSGSPGLHVCPMCEEGWTHDTTSRAAAER